MKLLDVLKWCATFGSIGYYPASGTVASFVALIFIIIVRIYVTIPLFTIFLLACISFIIIHCVQPLFNSDDPAEIVLDEGIGCLIASYNVPTVGWMLISFLLFRFFDISKRPFIWRIDRINNAFGIIFDDIVAGIFANILTHIIVHFMK